MSLYIIISWMLLLIACSVHAQNIQYNLSATAVFVSDTTSPFNMTLNVYPTKGYISINFTGPIDKWFGVGFGGNNMLNTYAIICSGTESDPKCEENQLGQEAYGTKLPNTIDTSTMKNVYNGGVRNVYFERAIIIDDEQGRYYNFSTWTSTINIIWSLGQTSTFSQSSNMGPHSAKRLTIANALDNNLTVTSTKLGDKIMLNNIIVYPDQDIVQINITGPDNVYFGIGFNGTGMGQPDSPVYSMVFDDTKSVTHEEAFTGTTVSSSNDLPSTINTIIYNNVTNGKRTVVFNRKRNITQIDNNDFAKYYEFPLVTTKSVPIIYAIGTTEQWASTYSNHMNYNTSTYGTINIDFDGPPQAYYLRARAQLPLSNVLDLIVDIFVSPLEDMVNITMIGPSNRWFGVGFDSLIMSDTYAIICSNQSHCFEQILGNGTIGERIPGQEIEILSDNIVGNLRNVTITRKQIITNLDNVNYQYFYDFPSTPDVIPIIYAYGVDDMFDNTSSMANQGDWPLSFDYSTNRSNLTASMTLFPGANQTIDIQVYPDTNQVDITFTGRENRWYGIGFNSSQMDGTYAIVVDSDNTANEYTLGHWQPGSKISTQTIDLTSDVVKDGIRTVKLSRPALTFNPDAYDFPFITGDVNIISSLGPPQQSVDYETSGGMANNTYKQTSLTFVTAGSGTFCKDGVTKYGVRSDIGDGFTIGLWIYCQQETIQLTVDYTDYGPNWFGIVFNEDTKGCQMAPHSNTTVFTTGKNNDRTLGLYAYDLQGTSIDQVIYYPEGNWKSNKISYPEGIMSIDYEQDLSKTKWTTSTSIINFCVAWGISGGSTPTKLTPHNGATNTAGPFSYNLATGTVTKSSSDKGYKKAHGIIMFIAWSVLTSIGIFSSRFRGILYKNVKNKAMWFLMHRGIQVFVVILVLIAFGIAIYFTQDLGSQHFSNTHEILGLVVVILGFLQPINAWFRPHPPKKGNPKSVGRLSWEIIHKSFGYITWIMAQIAIYLGIKQLTSDTTYLDLFIGWASIVFFIYILLWVYQTFCYIEPTKSSNTTKEQGLITNQQNVASPNNSLIGASERSDS